MDTQNSQCSQEINDLDRILRLRRARERNEREARKREDNHWNFVAGALVAKYLKSELNIPVFTGKDAAKKNAASFVPLENILSYLATHKEFLAQIMAGQNKQPPIDF